VSRIAPELATLGKRREGLSRDTQNAAHERSTEFEKVRAVAAAEQDFTASRDARERLFEHECQARRRGWSVNAGRRPLVVKKHRPLVT
jgi:hypothetical protein